jgi:succinoglycan biosynthesis protein ExoO
MPGERPTSSCRVSVIIAARNAGPYLDEALNSAREQTLAEIEFLVVDDLSTDDTRARALAHAAADARVTVLTGPGRGPGAARNLALTIARGTWLAILDADDIMQGERLARLVAEAESTGADIVADNLRLFYMPTGSAPMSLLLEGADWQRARAIDLTTYLYGNRLFSKAPALGYLKPLIRRDLLETHGIRYNESLRIAEDFDLVARILVAGGTFRWIPETLYFYRRHGQSTSFRTGSADIVALLAAADRFADTLPANAADEHAAAAIRRKSLVQALHFSTALDRIKARRPLSGLGLMVRHPTAIPLMLDAIGGTVKRRWRERFPMAAGRVHAEESEG